MSRWSGVFWHVRNKSCMSDSWNLENGTRDIFVTLRGCRTCPRACYEVTARDYPIYCQKKDTRSLSTRKVSFLPAHVTEHKLQVLSLLEGAHLKNHTTETPKCPCMLPVAQSSWQRCFIVYFRLYVSCHVLIHTWTTAKHSDPVLPLTKGLELQIRPISSTWEGYIIGKSALWWLIAVATQRCTHHKTTVISSQFCSTINISMYSLWVVGVRPSHYS